jgi:hypothetical protein
MFESNQLTKATRHYDGMEDDWYTCELGHEFGIDWSHGGPPSTPQWPPDPQLVAWVKSRIGD